MEDLVIKNFARTAIWVAVFTLIAKLLGFVRELVMAGYFGTGYITDCYVMAQTIPTILLGGILVALGTAYMPLLADIVERKGGNEGDIFTSRVINCLIILSIMASIVGVCASDLLVNVFASGFTGEKFELTSFYLKITFLYILFTSVAAIFETYLQYRGVFLTQILAGYVQNIIVIVLIIISAYTNHHLLALGLLLGNATRCIIIFYKSKKIGFKYSKSLDLKNTAVKIMTFAIPVFVGTYIQQINTFVDKTLASRLNTGSVSALYYSMLLITLITGLTSTILSTMIYPKLAQASSRGDFITLKRVAQKGIDLICIIAIPFSMGIVVYGGLVIRVIFERGAFNQAATSLTSSALILYGLGLTFLALNDFLIRIFYSLRDMKKPMIYASISVFINIIADLILVRKFNHNGLALATSLAFFSYTCMLINGINNERQHIKILEDKGKLVKIIISSGFAVGSSYIFYLAFCRVGLLNDNALLQLILIGVFASMIYLILLKIFRVEEIRLIKEVFKR